MKPSPDIPIIENIHRKVLDAVLAAPAQFDMGNWHGQNECGTTHCRGGLVVHLAGDAGRALEAFHDTPLAAFLIYQASSPSLPVKMPSFYVTNDAAMADMRRLAELEAAISCRRMKSDSGIALPYGSIFDPYGFGDTLNNRPIIHRTIPAKGTRVGILGTSGVMHKQFGLTATPGIVDELTARELFLRRPDGHGRFALHLTDPWELRPAADCQFFHVCAKCNTLGEVRIGRGDPCPGCNGCGSVNSRTCVDCNGHGVDKGGQNFVTCLDCNGWGVQFTNPFGVREQRRAKKTEKARASKAAAPK